MTRWLIVLIAAVGLGAGACATEDGYEQSPPAPRSTGVQVPAEQLLAAYAANATAADREYRGRVLIITGTVAAFGTDSEGAPYVRLGAPVQGVRCTFPETDVSQYAAIYRGERITVVGIGEGRPLTDILVRSCRQVS